jgi:hypothetical protein
VEVFDRVPRGVDMLRWRTRYFDASAWTGALRSVVTAYKDADTNWVRGHLRDLWRRSVERAARSGVAQRGRDRRRRAVLGAHLLQHRRCGREGRHVVSCQSWGSLKGAALHADGPLLDTELTRRELVGADAAGGCTTHATLSAEHASVWRCAPHSCHEAQRAARVHARRRGAQCGKLVRSSAIAHCACLLVKVFVPYQFCLPDHLVEPAMPAKTAELHPLLPGSAWTYTFGGDDVEKAYFDSYRVSRRHGPVGRGAPGPARPTRALLRSVRGLRCLTGRAAGTRRGRGGPVLRVGDSRGARTCRDCFRHYEVAGMGALPLMYDIESVPNNTLVAARPRALQLCLPVLPQAKPACRHDGLSKPWQTSCA